ncbi:MAG: hypothetical protein ACREFR_04670 [Limisphaerales bacterium]
MSHENPNPQNSKSHFPPNVMDPLKNQAGDSTILPLWEDCGRECVLNKIGIALCLLLHTLPLMDILNLSAQQLRQAAHIKEQIAELESQIQSILGGGGNGVPSPARLKKGRMSESGRLAIIAAQKARWANFKRTKGAPAKKGRFSAAARAKLAAAARLRWKKAKAAGKHSL